MERLPTLNTRQVIKALKRAGFIEDHQHGSHLYLVHFERHLYTSVPIHPGDLPRGTVRAIIRQSGMTEDEFRELL